MDGDEIDPQNSGPSKKQGPSRKFQAPSTTQQRAPNRYQWRNPQNNRATNNDHNNQRHRARSTDATSTTNLKLHGPRAGHSNNQNRYKGDGPNNFAPKQNRQQKENKIMHYNVLQKIVNDDAQNVFTNVMSKKQLFFSLIEEEITNHNVVVLTVKLLAIVSRSSFDEQKRKFLLEICNSKFIRSFREFLLDLATSKNKKLFSEYYFDANSFWNNFLVFSEYIVTTVPSVAIEKCKSLIDTSANYCLEYQMKNENFILPEDLAQKLKEIQTKLNHYEENENVEVSGRPDTKKDFIEFEEPMDNFRELSAFPSAEDILEKNQYVRPNIVDGEYRDVEHYLDIQFRLLREDYIGPLRDGLGQYISNPNSKKYDNIRIHQNVKIIEPYVSYDRVGYLLQLDFNKSRVGGIRWQNSKRFIHGSLLLLTNDNCKTFLFTTVMDRKLEENAKGLIPIAILNGQRNINYVSKFPYVLIETEVYFEPYLHVLNALREPRFPENLAMSKYIVKVHPQPSPPEYLKDDKVMLAETGGLRFRFKVLQNDTWPAKEDLGLNQSQYEAFRLALQNEFAVIQGPPGTGKTFVGLKIAETIINNYTSKQSLMLIVCYTNHALDQFLEGILKVTKSVVRIGGQSKNENMVSININNLRKFYLKENSRNSGIVNNFFDTKRELNDKVRENKEVLMIHKNNQVVSYKVFENKIKECEVIAKFYKYGKDPLHDWLFEHLSPLSEDVLEQLLHPPEDSDVYDIASRLGIIIDDLNEPENLQMPCSFRLNEATNALKYKRLEYEKQIIKIHKKINTPNKNKMEVQELKNEIHLLVLKINRFNIMLQFKNNTTNVKITDATDVRQIEMADRWMIYRQWEKNLIKRKKTQLSNKLQEELIETSRLYEEARMMVDLNILRSKQVIGLTTTGAARLRPLLQELAIPIIIVEEAAEVMEAHIVTALTKHTKHVILIGDHQQLRPSVANNRLARDFNIEVSLFERMIMNKVHSRRLDVQHRMRPEIAALISPHIYPELANHPSVENFPNVRGIASNMYFLTHDFNEETDVNSSSRKNVQEADLVLATANYLMQQGYDPEDITILAGYSSQMFYMRNERKKYAFLTKVKITVVDNYQGEESKIILLSLVRNNHENKIGFLSIPNRVCVALSRARHGFYMFGNINILKNNSDLWQNITVTLENTGALVTKMQLKCENHPDQITNVSHANDFANVPEGGCLKNCIHRLDCGHNCVLICHGYNIAHKDIKCNLPCERTSCELNHVCPQKCWEKCVCIVPVEKMLRCGHSHHVPCHVSPNEVNCPTRIKVTLPDCGHEKTIQCHQKNQRLRCSRPCELRVEACGHACTLLCHVKHDPDHLQYKCTKPCARLKVGCTISENEDTSDHQCKKSCHEACDHCNVEVKKKRPDCVHSEKIACHKELSGSPCLKKCFRKLPCNHFCQKKCSEKCGDCSVQVIKIIEECQHKIKLPCSKDADRGSCALKCERRMPCGHMCKSWCREDCDPSSCEIPTHAVTDTICGHKILLPCNIRPSECSRSAALHYCTAPCGALLACGHECGGACGACRQQRLHAPCRRACQRDLICGHRCEEPCNQVCPPCKKPCEVRCSHSKCPLLCGQPCSPCKEACDRECPHQRCTRRCGAACNVAACREPCGRRLRCGHACRGLCNDPCPDVCRVCRPDDFPKDFLGDDFDDDAKFVKLRDCVHILELDDMDNLMTGDTETVQIRCCPLCRKPIINTYRYKDVINRMIFNEIKAIKEKIFGNKIVIENKKKEVKTKLEQIIVKHEGTVAGFRDMTFVVKQILKSNNDKKLTNLQLEMHLIIVNIIEILLNCYCKCYKDNTKKGQSLFEEDATNVINDVCKVLFVSKNKISQQQQNDIGNELKRLNAIVNMEKIVEGFLLIGGKLDDYDTVIKTTKNAVLTWQRFDEPKASEALGLLKSKLKVTITMEERQLIVKAMGFKAGHWFKCPNGHFYCIADCGGAMVESKCNECGAKIGGSSHRLRSDNALASEMDGARFAAWSEEYNNMGNFDMN